MAFLLLMGIWFLTRGVAFSASTIPEKGQTVVIDVGHGGSDPGMIGIGQLEEKGVNLAIAWKLRKELEEKGFTVVMTREEDVGLYEEGSTNQKAQDMQKRCEIIAKVKPALTVSIHQNSYTDSSVCGPQVFYYEDSQEGERLAKVLQEALNEGLSIERPREAKGNRSYYLLKRSEGILNIVECGFLTNPREAELLVQEEYQQKVAESLCRGIEAYLQSQGEGASGKQTMQAEQHLL